MHTFWKIEKKKGNSYHPTRHNECGGVKPFFIHLLLGNHLFPFENVITTQQI